jgi:hypothetical protein
MKARDLAALAALGLGGAYLYNRNKGDATPKGAETVRGEAADFVNRGAAPAAAKEDITPAEMPAYQGRSADRREDIQSEYGGDMSAGMGRRDAGSSARGPVPNAMGVPDTEVIKRSEMDDLKGGRMPTRPGQSTSGVVKRPVAAAPLSSGRKPSVSQATMNLAKSQEIVDRIANRKRPYLKDEVGNDLKRGGAVKRMASGGSVSSASSRGDGIAQRGKTRGKMC